MASYTDFHISPLLLSEHTLCLFAASLANQGLQVRSIQAYLSALRHFQISAGLPAPPLSSWPWLHYVTRGIRRSQVSTHSRIRLSITASIMRDLINRWSQAGEDSFKSQLFQAVAGTAFFGFFRLGELLQERSGASPPLLLADISTDNHSSPFFFPTSIEKV